MSRHNAYVERRVRGALQAETWRRAPFEGIRRQTDRDPDVLADLYKAGWDADRVKDSLSRSKRLRRFVEGLAKRSRRRSGLPVR
jgi:hypothetical protein